MYNTNHENSAAWKKELRLGVFRSLGHFRGLLVADRLTAVDRAGLTDLLDLMEEYVSHTWPE